MNPLNLQVLKNGDDQRSHTSQNASALLRQHNYNPAVEEVLLSAAMVEQARSADAPAQAAGGIEQPRATSISPDAIQSTVPNLHREIMIVPDFLSVEMCDEYIEYCQQALAASAANPDANTRPSLGLAPTNSSRDQSTQSVNVAPIKDAMTDMMRHLVRDYLNPYYGVTIKDSESPQILAQSAGAQTDLHSDAETLVTDKDGNNTWVKAVDRDISIVLYLNDDYSGGDLVFPGQAISVQPRQGMLVAFPSTHHFVHQEQLITAGQRLVLVNWFSVNAPQIPVG
jgi:predicted 2-oxoglutarate/Fe(II)-dependent dioxygenase YbiX